MRKTPAYDRAMWRRFWSKVAVGDGCWEWLRNAPLGYGRFTIHRQGYPAHRVSYEWLVGPIPDGLQIDHLCRNTRCVRPDHLEPVTPRINTLRSSSITAQNARKSFCEYGHPLEHGVRHDGYRGCPTCHRRNWRESKRRLRAKERVARVDAARGGE